MSKDNIKVGDYIIIQKHNYKKLYKYNKSNSNVTLGRDNVNLSGIENCPYYSLFKLTTNSKKGREYHLELAEEMVKLKDEIDIKSSGTDNRNIVDDGRSQKLSHAEIAELAQDASKASDIVETLISNSKTFHNKTEFSQEKYLKKKEKKYCEYLQILKPNLRLIADVMYKLDSNKIQHLRLDTLSQMITMSNIHCEGNHLVYDSGSNGLLAAALLSAIGANTNGKLLHMHPGNMSQKQALLAMNFPEEQSSRCISVNIYSALRQYYQGSSLHDDEKKNSENMGGKLKRKAESSDDDPKAKISKQDDETEPSTVDKPSESEGAVAVYSKDTDAESKDITENGNKNKQSPPKKPKWYFDNITASEILTGKMDSLVIASKEDPKNIFLELLPFIKPGRPFVIYFPVAEPLQSLFIDLKPQANVAALKLTCNWMRNYQVLPERTHPEVLMNAQSGFLLSGYVLK